MKAKTGWLELVDTISYLSSNESNYQIGKHYFDTNLKVLITDVIDGEGYQDDEMIISKDEWTFFTEVV